MITSLVLVLLVTASGTLASYLYDDDAPFAARLCAGACTGIAALGLIGFLFASFFGLTPLAILLTLVVIVALPLIPFLNPERRAFIREELRHRLRTLRAVLSNPARIPVGYTLFYLIVAAILWRAFERAMIQIPEGIYTGVLNNFGDLPFHLSVITGFSFGNNFPPQDPTYAGVRFTYPFLTDFVSAIFVRCGADLRQSMFIENFVVGLSFVGLLHRWALVMLRDKLAALITPLLVLLNGGFGWVLLWNQLSQKNDDGLLATLRSLPSSFTIIPDTAWRWGNAVSTLLIPQRGFLLGLPLAVIVFTQWWLASERDAETPRQGDTAEGGRGEEGKRGKGKGKKSKRTKIDRAQTAWPEDSRLPLFPSSPFSLSLRRMIAAGIVAGLLPLVHAHSFVVVMVVGGFIALGLRARAWLAPIAFLVLLRIVATAAILNYLTFATANVLVAAMLVALAIAVWFLLPAGRRGLWYAFFITALIVALPQLWWSTHQSAVNSSSFFAFEFGWDSAKERYFNFSLAGSQFFADMPRLQTVVERLPDVVLFWLKNCGLFIPLTIVAMLWRENGKYIVPRRVVWFLLPFGLCFIIPNFMKLAPWIWDNIKVLFYWWLAAAPLVALLLARLWRGSVAHKMIAAALFVCVTLAGALDVNAIVLRSQQYQIFNAEGIQFAELVKRETPPNALVIHAPVHNHPVFLTGRRSLMGYPGHVWTHGLEFAPRELEIKRIYAGSPDAVATLWKYKVDYAVVGPLETGVMNVDQQFFSRFQLVGEVGGYRLYKITQP